MRAFVLDRATFGKAKVLDNGMLRAPAKLSKVGVFPYFLNGKIRQVFRSAEELFKPEVLESFEQVPLVDEHPYKEGGLVTSKNASRLGVGSVAGIKRDGDFMIGTVVVTDAKSIEKIQNGKDQLSSGYECNYVEEVGVFEGKPYDLKQTNIGGNHIAMTLLGRMGPEVRIELDSDVALMVECDEMSADTTPEPISTTPAHTRAPTPEVTKQMVKITLDGLDFEVEPTVAQAIEKTNAAHAKVIAETTARADAAESKIKTLDSAIAEANDPARLQVAVTARVAIENKAREFLAKGTDLTKLTDGEIKRAVITALDSTVELTGKSEDYVQAMFDASVRLSKPVNPLTVACGKAVAGDAATPTETLSPKAKMLQSFFAKK